MVLRATRVVLVLLTVLALASTRTEAKSAEAPLPVLTEVPRFSFLDQDGVAIGNADLLGHVWIADFIFTHCTTACPILSARLSLVQRQLADPSLRFLSFSVDPEHDTPAVLKAYAARWRREPRWRLLATTQRGLGALVAGLGLEVTPTDDPADPIEHSDGFVLVDEAGMLRGLYRRDETARLIADVARLTSRARGSAPSGHGGAQLFVELGCAGCHGDPHVASPLGGLFGTKIQLADGKQVLADEDYLRESILQPQKKLVAGYPATMPSYEGAINRAQLDALVAYVKALPAPAAPAQERTLSIDPVCKMQLSAGPDSPQVVHHGKTHYFCSDLCRQRFVADPSRYSAH
jgi:cytochrome oxidase Cu insertion factor (SCO1/SenC/PrrC family)/YHS domain-containing protein